MTNVAEKAKAYAYTKHVNQTHGTRPFTQHLTEDVETLHEFGIIDENGKVLKKRRTL